MLYKLLKNKDGRYVDKEGRRYDVASCKYAYCMLEDGLLGRDTECGYEEFKDDEEFYTHYGISEYVEPESEPEPVEE